MILLLGKLLSCIPCFVMLVFSHFKMELMMATKLISEYERREVVTCECAKSSWCVVCSLGIYILVVYSRKAGCKSDPIPINVTCLEV
jgi:hypothetical protein